MVSVAPAQLMTSLGPAPYMEKLIDFELEATVSSWLRSFKLALGAGGGTADISDRNPEGVTAFLGGLPGTALH